MTARLALRGLPASARRSAGDLAWLGAGRGAGLVLAVAATALTARALGAEGLGGVVLLHAAALALRQTFTVRTAEAAVRFGVPLLDAGAPGDAAWRDLAGGLLRIELAGALVAGIAAAAGAAALGGWWPVALPSHEALATGAWAYVPALLFAGGETARGTLRARGLRQQAARPLAAGPAARLVGVAVCVAGDAPLGAYAAVWAGSLAAEQAIALIAAGPYLARPRRGAARAAFAAHPELRRFLWAHHVQSALELLPRRGVLIGLGALFGAEAAGVYRVARDIAAVGGLAPLVRQGMLPELTRLWAAGGKGLRRLATGAGTLGALAGAALVAAGAAFGAHALALVAGEAFRGGAGLLVLLLAAAALDLACAPLWPSAHVIGRSATAVGAQAVAAVAAFAVLFAVAPRAGIEAAGWSALAAAAVPLAVLAVVLRRAP